MSKKIIGVAAAALMLAGTSQAIGGNYSTGVQIGSAPTAAQQAFHDDQMRIRYEGDFLHENEHRNGGKLVIRVTKVVWHKLKTEIYRKRMEWFPAPKTHHKSHY